MSNLFKQSRGKGGHTSKHSASKRRASANAQVPGLRFGKKWAQLANTAPEGSGSDNSLTVTIDSMDWMGQGVVRGQPMYFVQGAIPGETCNVETRSVKKNVVNATVSDVVTSSPHRVLPFCPVFERCGGCQLQHIEPEVALAHRDSALKSMMQRQLAMKDGVWQAPLYGNRPQYRRKARLAIDARNSNNIKLGFREVSSNKVVNIDSCPILVEPLGRLIGPLRRVLAEFDSTKYIGHIGLLAGNNVSQITLKHTKALQRELVQALETFGVEHKVRVVLENNKSILSALPLNHAPAPDLLVSTYQSFYIKPASNDFIQVNSVVNEKMIGQALSWLNPQKAERIADWFSGLGNFTLPIAKTGAHVQAIEGVAEMVRRAKDNAHEQGITHVEWLHLDLADKVNVDASLSQGVDKVLLDPSREGALTVCHALVKALPKAIVYVSCNPSTFSRDAKVLIDGGYEMEKAGIAEMFPFTHHMEMMALFTRIPQ